jgi:hypothetical protein
VSPKAPPLAPGVWLTTPALGPAHLAGRVTIIVFWSIGNEASWLRLRQLEDLSADLGDTLAIIAVHSPRHPDERDPAVVDRMIERVGVPFPVLHDPDLTTWARYNPGGWPATVVIDHRGRLMGISQGIDELDVLFEAVTLAERLARAERPAPGTTQLRPLPTPPPAPNRRSADTGLAWPSGLCLLADGRVAIADSGNDRVLVVELAADLRQARVRRICRGLDRPAQVCQLADGELIASEPAAGRIVRIVREGSPDVIAEGFLRPRGLAVDRDGSIVVADAAANLVFRIHPDGTVGPIAGRGSTGCTDGRAPTAEFAQPIAVARAEAGITLLDAASNSLRVLTDDGVVRTVIGGEMNRAGLLDGPADSAALDRPMGVAVMTDGSVAIADTGNDRLRILSDRLLSTIGVVGLDRPEAVIELSPGLLLVADTGNHRLVGVDVIGHRVWAIDVDEPARTNGSHTDSADLPVRGLGRSPGSDDPAAIVAAAGSRIVLDHPTPGEGPWQISVVSNPPELLGCPLRVTRSEPGQPVTVEIGRSGSGHVAVHAVGPDPATARVVVRSLTIVDR